MRLFLLFLLPAIALAATPEERAQELKEFLSKEKPQYERREAERQGVLEELDQLNLNQNQVRNRISEILANRQEVQMALENLSMEVEKHRAIERDQEQRLFRLMKLVNKIRRDGAIRFALSGSDLGEIAGRVRVLFRTLRMHALISDQVQERAQRLADSEKRLSEARESVHFLLTEMQEQESLLRGFLDRKKEVLVQLNRKQEKYKTAVVQWNRVSKELNQLFESLEAERDSDVAGLPKARSLSLPLESGRLVRAFGKYVHPKFGTVTFHKGIEIEAEQSSPVRAIMDGNVEFEGWVRGLGNVLILHHGGGFYSLHAHLFKTLQAQGANVKKGDTIGLVGDTGNSDKPSLYFELRENGKAVDPSRYFSLMAIKGLRGA